MICRAQAAVGPTHADEDTTVHAPTPWGHRVGPQPMQAAQVAVAVCMQSPARLVYRMVEGQWRMQSCQ